MLAAVHPQVLVVDMLMLPEPPTAVTKSDPRASEYVHAGEGVGAGGVGAGDVSVSTTSTCTWTAVSNAPWITVAPGVRTGSGSVEYHHTANPGPQRAGTITIAGLTFTVTQPPAP